MKVFISYCHEIEISLKSLKLADKLINTGVDCIIDQYIINASEGWPKWMDTQIREAEFVLIVCTKKYLDRLLGNDPTGKGVQFETTLSYNQIFQNHSLNDKFIPIVFNVSDLEYIPDPLKSYNHYCLDKIDGFESLYRRLTNQPRNIKPDMGQLKLLPSEMEALESSQYEIHNDDFFFSNNTNTTVDIENLEIELCINRDFDKYSEKEQQKLLFAIKNLLELNGDLTIKQKRKGSVILKLELTPDQCEKLHLAIMSGQFIDFGVVGSKILNESFKKYKNRPTNEDALEASLDYFKGDDLAARVWVNKYALKDSFGQLFELTPDDMHRRLASEIARIEKNYDNPMTENEIFLLLKDFKYIVPQGGPMTGIGNDFQIASLSNCFVIGNEDNSDSYGGILKVDQEQVQLMKRRGGVGHDLSHIRPKGSPVKNSALASPGIVPFMERYSNSTREVAQDGRRGALMLSISIKHPDTESFIDAKLEKGKVNGANISIKIDDNFMRTVEAGEKYMTQYPIDTKYPQYTKEIDADGLWKKIVHNAWKSAEPGILFWDTIIKESVPDCYSDLGFKTISTNPCGEIPLCAYDSCRLIAVNLFSYVKYPFTKRAKFNFDQFKKHVGFAQRMMDDIIDLELEKIDGILHKIDDDPESEEVKYIERAMWIKIQTKAKKGRRTGLGITAEGDMLAALGLRYGSDDATDFSEEIHKTLALEAYRASVLMAKERGPFTIYNSDREKNNPMIKRLSAADEELYQDMLKYGRRNIALLAIAPTGTTSLMTQTTSGIEPVFMPVYKRRRKVNPNDKNVIVDFVDVVGDSWEEYVVFHHKFRDWMEVNGFELKRNYPKGDLDELITKSPYFKATSYDIDCLSKVRMQGRIQKWVDHSISVTINLPSDADEELVGKLYFEAWKSGCKGLTVYRDGSRSGVLLSYKKEEETEEIDINNFPIIRPPELDADVVRFHNLSNKWIAFIGTIDGRPYEIFTGLSDDENGILLPHSVKNGKIIKYINIDGSKRFDFQYTNKQGYPTTIEGLSFKFNPVFWNYAKLISGVLRHGMPIHKVVDTVIGLQFDNDTINSWKAGVALALRKYIPDGTVAEGSVCCECGLKNVIYMGGCLVCTDCGSAKCG